MSYAPPDLLSRLELLSRGGDADAARQLLILATRGGDLARSLIARSGLFASGAWSFEAAGRSDTGTVRERNEDYAMVASDGFAVFDGMGGTASGAVGAWIAAELSGRYLSELGRGGDREVIGGALPRWQQNDKHIKGIGELIERGTHQLSTIPALNEDDPSPQLNALLGVIGSILAELPVIERFYSGTGATAAVALHSRGRLTFVSVGDCRAYCFAGGALRQITKDETLLREYLDRGLLSEDEIDAFPYKHVVIKALGISSPEDTRVNQTHVEALDPQAIYLLCTDGLKLGLSDDQLTDCLRARSMAPLADLCDRLIEEACVGSLSDNIAVVLFRVGA